MARQARIVLPGVPHHVTQRGNNAQDVFFVDADRRMYLSYLKTSAARNGVRVSAYCLMTNHIHLVLTPEKTDSLAKTMARAHMMYVQYIHELHGRLGHFWQGRFYSCPLDEQHAHNATAYIELNPVRAGIVRNPWDYPWSSAAAHCGKKGDASGLLDLRSWSERMPPKEWRATLQEITGSDAAIDRVRLHTRTGRPLGDDAFLSKVETLLGRRIRSVHRGRPKGSKDNYQRKRRKKAKV